MDRAHRKKGPASGAEWIDGFLFVGNQFALDFLNTKLVSGNEELELLPDALALQRWLAAAGRDSDRPTGLSTAVKRGARPTEDLTREIRAFRERLRLAVFAQEAGQALPAPFVEEMNGLLFDYPQRIALSLKDGTVKAHAVSSQRFPESFWADIAAASAAVFTSLEQPRLRKCANCVVHFYDTSKKGSRRWCSMDLCGNKLKVAAYQDRQRITS